MVGTVEKKLQELGIVLAEPKPPIANYVPFVRTGNMLTVSGQLCFDNDGTLVAKGQLGGGLPRRPQGNERRVRSDGRCLWRQGQTRALDGWRRSAAGRCRGRSRG